MRYTTFMEKDVSIVTRCVLTLTFFFIISAWHVNAQSNSLKKKITIEKKQVAVKTVLTDIEQKGDFSFSYNVNLFNGDSIVSIKFTNTAIVKILDHLFEKRLNYKVIGNHVVIVNNYQKKSKKPKKEITGYKITGYIIDAQTGKKIKSATIYDISGNITAITDQSGFYELSVSDEKESRTISYCKNGYQDTIIIVSPINKNINIQLKPDIPSVNKIVSIEAVPDTFSNKSEMNIDWIVAEDLMINAENLEIYEHRIGQVSFLPRAGSNGKLGGAVVNNMSLNVLAGYADGVDGVEIGGLMNIDRSYVNGVQIAGIGNIVGKYMTGVQISGFTNKNVGSIKGVQIAGFNNIVNDTIKGVQIAGFSNVLKGKMGGVQIAGFHNHTTRDVEGVQIAGFANTTKQNVVLVQIGGFLNYCKNVNGVQIAGFLNKADNVKNGVQIAGFINLAKKVEAVQIGVINICDTTKGISIGFYNHIKKGYRAIELSTDEVYPTNISYKAGTKRLFYVYNLGFDPFGPYKWCVGMGIGTIWKLNKRFQFDLEVTANAANETKVWEDEINLRSQIDPSLEFVFLKRFSLVAGPTLNVHLSAVTNPDTGEFSSTIAKNTFYEFFFSKNRVQFWPGFNVALRFAISKYY